LHKEPAWRNIPAVVVATMQLTAADGARLNPGIQSVLVNNSSEPREPVERIRRPIRAYQPSDLAMGPGA
jgi:hypothetical protein